MSISRVGLTYFSIVLILAMAAPLILLAQTGQDTLAQIVELPSTPSCSLDQATPAQQREPASQPQQSVATTSPQTAIPTLSERQKAEEQLRVQEKQRILAGVVPNFNMVNGQQAPPLTAGQKYRLAFRSSIDPFAFGAAAFLALIGQAEDSHEGYHQGVEGYAKRFGANYADSFSGTFFGNAFFPAVLHEDPRYFRIGSGTFRHRLLYSASTTIRTRTDSGRRTWNYANVLGNIAAGGLSNVYYPQEDRGVALTFENAATVTAEGALGALWLEFYPNIAKKLFKPKQQPDTSATSPQPAPSDTPQKPIP